MSNTKTYRHYVNGTPVYVVVPHSSTYFPPDKRNGGKECARRIKQGLAGLHYPNHMNNHTSQAFTYPLGFCISAAQPRK